MAIECEERCPRLINSSVRIGIGAIIAPTALSFQINTHAMLLEDSQHCSGPVTEVIDVQRGIIHGRIEEEEKVRCGLDEPSDPLAQPVNLIPQASQA